MKMNWRAVYDLWHREPCNILAIGPDVQMVEPTKIFGEFKEFRMFNWTDPKSYDGANPWGVKLPNFFNGDMKYYPHTMKEETWELGLKMTETWPEDNTPEAKTQGERGVTDRPGTPERKEVQLSTATTPLVDKSSNKLHIL